MMEEPRYVQLVDKTFRAIQDAFEDVDPDDADVYMAGDVLTIAFRNGVKCVVNTQRPTRQIWLAGSARGWHFSYDAAQDRWLDDKGRGEELYATLSQLTEQAIGRRL